MQQIILALLLAFLVALALGPLLIPMLKRLKFGQTVRDDGPQTHLSKSGTPTMGGLMMLSGILVGTLSFTVGSMDVLNPGAANRYGSFALVELVNGEALCKILSFGGN